MRLHCKGKAHLSLKSPATSCSQHRARQRCSSRHVLCRGVVPAGERDGWWRKDPAPNLVEVQQGLEDIMAILEANRDRLVLIDFFAPWCASCKALYPKLNKLCQDNPENLVIAKLNFEENKELAKRLGVKVLPFFQAYHGSMGRVAAFSSSITKIQRLKDCIQLFGQPYCDIASHNGAYDIGESLPEFDNLPHPDDATILKFDTVGEYDQEATMEHKRAQSASSSSESEQQSKSDSESHKEDAQPAAA